MLEASIRPIFRHHNLPDVHTIAPLTGGTVNSGFYVNDEYVIRFNKRDPHIAKYRREAIAYRYATGIVPVPQVIALDESRQFAPFDAIILERLAGEELESALKKVDEAEQRRLKIAAGRLLATLNGIVTDEGGFGRPEAATFPTWFDFLSFELNKHIAGAQQFDLLTQATIDQIQAQHAAAEPLLRDVMVPHLVHGDFGFWNMNVAGGQINGIYDFEWAVIGDPLFEFRDSAEIDALVRAGYEQIRPISPHGRKRIRHYKLLYQFELLPVAHQHWGADDVAWVRQQMTRWLSPD